MKLKIDNEIQVQTKDHFKDNFDVQSYKCELLTIFVLGPVFSFHFCDVEQVVIIPQII
jgi:hypothetical protein